MGLFILIYMTIIILTFEYTNMYIYRETKREGDKYRNRSMCRNVILRLTHPWSRDSQGQKHI